MQSVIGVVLATLTVILRDAAERNWGRGPLVPEAPPAVGEPTPAPAARVEVSCTESSLNICLVEDIIRRARSESCVCELICDSTERDTRLVFIATFSVCAGQSCILVLYCGRIVTIRYPGEDLWHERVMMGPGLRDEAGVVTKWWILTPDGDFYEEDISMKAGEGERPVGLDLAGSCPRAMRGRFYRFADDAYPSDDRVRREAQQAVARMRAAGQEPPTLLHFVTEDGVLAPLSGVGRRLRRGGAAGVGGGDAVAVVVADGAATPELPLPLGAAPPGGEAKPVAGEAVAPYLAVLPERQALREGLVWLVTENAEGHETPGMEVTPRAGDVIITTTDGLVHRRGSFLRVQAVPSCDCVEFARALRARHEGVSGAVGPAALAAPRAAEQAPSDEDVRTLWVDNDGVGERYKSWKKAVQESRGEPISAVEVQGPPSTLPLARHVRAIRGRPAALVAGVCADSNIFKTDRVYHEMATLRRSRAPGRANCGLRQRALAREAARAPPTADEAAEAAVMRVGAGGAAELDESLARLESLAELQVREGARDFYKPPEVALRELLCEKASGYRMGASSTTLAPYQRGRVSLPEKRTSAPNVSDLVGDRGRYFLEGAGGRMLDPTFSNSFDDDAERCYVDQQFASSPTLYARFIRDLKDACHRMGIPTWLSRWFGLPPVRAAGVGLTDALDGPVGPDEMVTPMPRRLPMGFSWSLFPAQGIDEGVASQVLSRAELLRDRGQPPAPTLRGEAASDTKHYIYVDNIGVFGSDGSVVASKLEGVCAAFEAKGLAVHEVATSDSGVEALGVLLDGRRRHTRLTAKRFWRVRGASLALAGRRRASGRQVEIALGHAAFCRLVRRETLSVFATVYPFIRRRYDQPAPLWPSVADELRAFAGLMVLLVSSWESDWDPLVAATDASETGYGICTRWLAAEDVAAVGRCRERDRYLAEGRVGARAAALGAEPPPCEPLGVEGCLGRADPQSDPHFAEAPSCMTDPVAWAAVGGWKFEQPEDIMALEAEGELGVAALARSACEPGLADSEVRLILEQLKGLIKTDPRFKEASSSDNEGEVTAAVRQRTLPRSRKATLTKLLASEALPELSHLTLGEHAAVRPRTEAQHAQEVHQCSLLCGVERATEIPIENLDDLLVQYIDHQIKSGVTAARGMEPLAGVVHARPQAGKQGPHTLQRSWRALKGWQNLCPSTSRLPEAWPIWCATVNGLRGMGGYEMALFICLAWSTYARPIQLMALKPECLCAPGRVATYWTVQLNPEVDGAAAVQKVARDLGFNLVVYQARHSGASTDMASRRRTLAGVKQRGGWKSDRSVVRCEKGARLSSTWMAHPSWPRQHAAQCEEEFVEILVHGHVLPKPALHSR
ncbi:unnamed protein product [Prorocentrum cordatum]|uniref:RNA-directed RNA polymerase n=1 Tax=Prorocentrum cordatum TaxID=2364126 RepID=A0ABN9RXI0_9DINO|nr:unnamed protein product [Polarella glacialis]